MKGKNLYAVFGEVNKLPKAKSKQTDLIFSEPNVHGGNAGVEREVGVVAPRAQCAETEKNGFIFWIDGIRIVWQ